MIYDVKTKNISFLRVSKMLRDAGVINNKFMLTLYDEDLVGVDPHSKHLSSEMQIKIYREICRNVWYFIREVVRIPADGASIPYQANLGNITLTYLREQNKNIILILPRQSGKTLGSVIFDIWNHCFVTMNANEVYLNKGKQDAIKNLKLFSNTKELLPIWLRDNFIEDKKNDIDNQEKKLLARRNNEIKVVSGGSDPDSADKAGRGLTTSTIIFDEFAFLKYNDISYRAALPAFSRASENAKKNGTPYGIIITTTPNNLDVPAGAFCYGMMNNAVRWSLKCFDIPINELDHFVSDNSQNDFIFVQYSYKELGRSEAWLEKQRRAIGDLTTLKREVLLEWPRSMDSSVFTEEQLDRVFKFIKPVKCSILVRNKYSVNFFETPDMNTNYILSCDVSGGLSSDNSVISIIHPEDFRMVGEFKSAKIDTDSFRGLIEDLMTFYMPNALLVIEKTGIGLPLLDALMKNPQIEPRMYREARERQAEKTQSDGFTVKRKTKTIVYGVDTTKQTRAQMIDLLFDIVENDYDKIISENLYHDLVTLERKKNGRIEAAAGSHDDSMMSYLIFRWAVFYGTCFRDRFGISSTPSKFNIKVVSSQENFSKISAIIENANRNDISASAFVNNPIYDTLSIQQQRLQEDEQSNSNKQINAFMNILKFNNE